MTDDERKKALARERNRRYRQKHKAKCRAYRKAYLANHPEQRAKRAAYMKNYIREYYRKNKAAILARCDAYRRANLDTVRERQKAYLDNGYRKTHNSNVAKYTKSEKGREAYQKRYEGKRPEANARLRKWKHAHRDRVNADKMKRIAAQRRAVPPWANLVAIAAVYELAAQLSRDTDIPHHVDHIVPLTNPVVCGLHVHWNLRAIPDVENIRKNNRFTPHIGPLQEPSCVTPIENSPH